MRFACCCDVPPTPHLLRLGPSNRLLLALPSCPTSADAARLSPRAIRSASAASADEATATAAGRRHVLPAAVGEEEDGSPAFSKLSYGGDRGYYGKELQPAK